MIKVKNFLDYIARSQLGRRGVILAGYLILLFGFLYLSVVRDVFFPPRQLVVYTFADMFHPDTIAAFEKKFGVKVIVRYFDSNEELLAKLKISHGIGYDVFVPSDYIIEYLQKENLLLNIDRQKIPSFLEIDKRLKKLGYEDKDCFSLPYVWIPYGVIFHKNLFSTIPDEISLKMLFEKQYSHGKRCRIAMTDDAKETAFAAALYLFKSLENLSDSKLASITSLLIRQKDWVECYTNQDLSYSLFSGLIKIAFAPIFAISKVLATSEDFVFRIPTEGSFISVENIAISRATKNPDLAHQFLDFVLSREEMIRMGNFYGLNPANAESYPFLAPEQTANRHVFPDDELFARLHQLPNTVPEKVLEEIWLAVKSA